MKLKMKTRIAAIIGLTGASVLGAGLSAQAASPVTQYSGDMHAKSVVTITWYGRNHAHVAWQNFDLKSDGKGAIMSIDYSRTKTASSAAFSVAYDHVTSGAGMSDLSTDDPVDEDGIAYITITECNGGSRYNGQNCDQSKNFVNPDF